ncbi:MAG: peptidylprolyl isomerase [Polyangiaceae bacterium]
MSSSPRIAVAAVCLALAGCSSSREPARDGEVVSLEVSAHSTGAVATRGTASTPRVDPLRDPSRATLVAPPSFNVQFETSAGRFDMVCTREWAPHGVDRIYNLVRIGYFKDIAFFRVIKSPRPFIVQFGLHGDPTVNAAWKDARLEADTVVGSNRRGVVSFAMAGAPTTRTVQLFINLGDNPSLDGMGFAPVCIVTGQGMDVVDKLYGDYAEAPSQARIQDEGNVFLRQAFPNLDYIVQATMALPAN